MRSDDLSYSKEIFDEVDKKLYNTRLKSREELESKREFLYANCPRAKAIEQELSATAIHAAKAVLTGKESKNILINLKNNNKILHEELDKIIQELGLPQDYLELNYSCEKCKDEGFVDGLMCECMKNMLRQECYKQLNKSSALELSSFESFKLDYYPDDCKKRMSDILEFCKNYARKFTKNAPGLLFTGKTGLGKTHLSLSIAREVINKGYGVIYSTSQNIISKLEREKFKNTNIHENTERHFIECDLLIIDDLGTEFSAPFSEACIYNIINSRTILNKPIIISTNFGMREFQKKYGESTVSRIIGNNIRLEFLGTDIRQKLLKEYINKL